MIKPPLNPALPRYCTRVDSAAGLSAASRNAAVGTRQ
jgi:hypothetical protein